MRGWLVEAIREAGTMRLAELAMPVPGAGEVLLRVEAAGVNFLDTLMVRGRYQKKPALPFTPGVEFVGATPAGQRVFAMVETGAFAEYAAAPADALRPVPDDVPSADAVALLGVNYSTGHYALHDRAKLRPGETVLVHAAAGGVGSAAVQIGKAAGCRVVATAGGAAKGERVRALGADEVIDTNDPGWAGAAREAVGPGGADVVFDPVGGDTALESLRLLAWQGRYLVIGFAAGAIEPLPPNRLLLKEAAAIGVFWGAARARDPAMAERTAEAVLALYRQGLLPPLIGGRYPLDRADAALAGLAGRQTVGKLIIDMPR